MPLLLDKKCANCGELYALEVSIPITGTYNFKCGSCGHVGELIHKDALTNQQQGTLVIQATDDCPKSPPPGYFIWPMGEKWGWSLKLELEVWPRAQYKTEDAANDAAWAHYNSHPAVKECEQLRGLVQEALQMWASYYSHTTPAGDWKHRARAALGITQKEL